MQMALRLFVQNGLLLLALLIVHTNQLLNKGLGSDDEVRLVDHLFQRQGYNPLIRPVQNLSDKVTVQFGLAMVQLINVDEKNQIMKSNVWLRMLWFDYQLKWDPLDFGGIEVIRILPEKVWKPDIVLFNNADGKYEVSYKPNVVIHHEGNVLWIPPAIYKSSCTIDVEFFPFDEQTCDMKFGSWTFNGDQVDLQWYEGQKSVDLSDYVNSGTWDIIDCPGEYSYEFDKDEGYHTAQIIFKLQIRRKTLFYTVNLIIPCVLISFLSVCVFYLPADAGEKMTMCISILLALVVFLLLVSKILPPTSITIPLIAKYLLFTFIMNIFTILITVIIINWNFRTPRTHRMPKWVRVVFLNYLPRILFMSRPNHKERWMKKTYYNNRAASAAAAAATSGGMTSRNATNAASYTTSSCGGDAHERAAQHYASRSFQRHPDMSQTNARSELLELSEMHHPNCKLQRATSLDAHQRLADHTRLPDSSGSGGGSGNIQMTPEAHKAIEAVRFIAAHLKNEDDYGEILEDWRYIAMVIDRLMLYIFLGVTISGTIGVLMSAKNIFTYVDQDAIKRKIMGIGADNYR